MSWLETLRNLPGKRPWAFWLVTIVLAIIVFEPLTDLWKALLTQLLKASGTALVDQMYRDAADDPMHEAVLTILAWMLAGIGFLGGQQLSEAGQLRKSATQLLREVKGEVPSRATGSDLVPRAERIARTVTRSTLLLQVVIAVTLVWLLMQFFTISASVTIADNHQSRMAVLEPVLTSQEVAQLRGDWYRVRGRDDYERLRARMDNMASARKIQLPGMDRKPLPPSGPAAS